MVRDGDTRGVWDGDRLGRVASNLIGNALHHGRRGEPVVVELDGQRADGVALRVKNRGEIPPELLEQVWEPFYSGRSHAARGAGLGLGLYIVREIVRAHGGRADVHSGGDLTVFEIWLPRRAQGDAGSISSSPSLR